MLGSRFLLLNHTGRKSGRQRQTVLEVAGHDREAGTYLVASGWGPRSDWYQNVSQNPQVIIQVGTERLQMVAEPLTAEQSGEAMVDYARRYPAAARALTRFIGYQVDGSESAYRQLGQIRIPFVRFRRP
jgi:deazaflavin-dependent oxidoreductase (nitroreductase family)